MKRSDRKYQIEFRGLRYFLEKSQGRITRKQLVSEIRRFLDNCGAQITGTVYVEFRRTKHPTAFVDGVRVPIMGKHTHAHSCVVYLRTSPYLEEHLDTVGHELDHEVWQMEGKAFNNSLPYLCRPHEVRAREVGHAWRLLLT